MVSNVFSSYLLLDLSELVKFFHEVVNLVHVHTVLIPHEFLSLSNKLELSKFVAASAVELILFATFGKGDFNMIFLHRFISEVERAVVYTINGKLAHGGDSLHQIKLAFRIV